MQVYTVQILAFTRNFEYIFKFQIKGDSRSGECLLSKLVICSSGVKINMVFIQSKTLHGVIICCLSVVLYI